MSSSIPLTQAVTSGDESAVSALLADGADVNESTSGGQTALILAVIFGHTNLVKMLVKAGADPHLRDNLGLNAIEWAQRRGLTEVLEILTSSNSSGPAKRRIVVNLEQPEKSAPQVPPAAEAAKEKLGDEEKSRRWISGLKQRLDELEGRKLNRNESPAEPRVVEAPPPMTKVATEKPAVINQPEAPVETVAPKTEPITKPERATGRVITAPPATPSTGKRKRCPKCNAIYNGELVSYCAHHIVPLVDADEPIISEPPKNGSTMFWILLVITLSGSIVIASLITTYLYKANQPAPNNVAAQPNIQKGLPEVGGELAGKAVLLPEALCPLTGPEPVSGTVTVRVLVDKKGQVSWARGSGGDWLMRGAATEAAMKSTFAPEKLRGREVEGTITYTFKPQ